VNGSGLEATATRDVRILSPTEVRSPRQTYNFSGQGKAVSTDTHKNIKADDAGYMDFSVTSIDKNMTIKIAVKNQSGAAVFTNTYTGVGGTQFWAEAGTYSVEVTISAANGNSKYGIRLVAPETMYLTFDEVEVPLGDDELIRYYISDEGMTPLEICLKHGFPPEALNKFYLDFIAAGWSDEDLEWFGLEMILEDGDVPLASFYERPIPLSDMPDLPAPAPEPPLIPHPAFNEPARRTVTFIVTAGDSLWKLAEKFYRDGERWHEIYEANKAAIGWNASNLAPGTVLTIVLEG